MSYFAVAIYHPKFECNVGTLFRSAHAFGASALFTVGRRYRRQASDTTHAAGQMPLLHFDTVEDLIGHLPHGAPLVGVEIGEGAEALPFFKHPRQATYLLGAEDHWLPPAVLKQCHKVVQVPSSHCLNVAVAGSVVLYDRVAKCRKTP